MKFMSYLLKSNRIDILAYIFASLELIISNPGINNKLHLSILIPELIYKFGNDNFKLRDVVLTFLRKLIAIMNKQYILNTFLPYLS